MLFKKKRKTLVGIVTFGNLPFTKLTVNSMRETTKNKIDFYLIVGKPGDTATIEWLEQEKIPHKVHDQKYGFPYSINDIYDYARKDHNYDNLIIAGNDIVTYPYAMDSLINLAKDSEYLVISGCQFDVRNLVDMFPETRQYFSSGTHIFTAFDSKPWEVFKEYSEELAIADMQLSDIQNLCLYKKEIFDLVGYTDVGFYPAYYIDNDYARRLVNSKVKCCTLGNARFFHFWSRTIHQETGGSTSRNFENNRSYYIRKWGGDFGAETKEAAIKIDSREREIPVLEFWKNA
jgi:GT2 family glycosyltransferase